jgi:hypothetical protein
MSSEEGNVLMRHPKMTCLECAKMRTRKRSFFNFLRDMYTVHSYTIK